MILINTGQLIPIHPSVLIPLQPPFLMLVHPTPWNIEFPRTENKIFPIFHNQDEVGRNKTLRVFRRVYGNENEKSIKSYSPGYIQRQLSHDLKSTDYLIGSDILTGSTAAALSTDRGIFLRSSCLSSNRPCLHSQSQSAGFGAGGE